MRAGIYQAAANIAVGELEKPAIHEGEALIRVVKAGICGTDMMIYAGKHPRAKAPLAMGHEFSGVIEEIKGQGFQIGDRVVVEPTLSCGQCEACKSGQTHVCKNLKLIGIDRHGGFAEYVSVPVDRLHRVPDELSDSHAALAEPVAVAVHTVRRSDLKVADNVVILGAGPIGLLIGLIAKEAGASQIVISDISPYRLKVAREMGFTAIDAKGENVEEIVASLTDNVGADIVFEVAGSQITADQMVNIARIQGQIVVVSVYKTAPKVELSAMHFKELSLTTTRCYSHEDFKKAIQLMAGQKIDVSPLISHELPIEEIEEGFKLMENPDESLKVLFQPNN
ncbi:zinc-dependent alcohol dehydrogenase [Sediminibacillus massiliensis]|uniref:zinc-dependent alcohol dehydrogenase n=1 Tax=Sediminibacillus massiliensis TaxID=1926277 RepID=UPI0009885B9F|nr:alcohol dehydrogenase catalytic domain-containing protein [Sediminibacillus massiliensis]